MVDGLTEETTSPDMLNDFGFHNDISASLQKKSKLWRYGQGAKGADIASAATLNLDNATGDLIDVTGTTAITAITLAEGRHRTVRFTGVLVLTNGASLVNLGAANITTAAGDFAKFRGYASGVVRMVGYERASGAALAGSGIGGSTGATDNAVLRADGTGGATVQSSQVKITDAGALLLDSGNVNGIYAPYASFGTSVQNNSTNTYIIDVNAGNGYTRFIHHTDEVFRVDGSTTGGHTRMMIWDVDNGVMERVSVGAADSGGAGFKLLRIPN
mgnify:CR=1 FL=1